MSELIIAGKFTSKEITIGPRTLRALIDTATESAKKGNISFSTAIASGVSGILRIEMPKLADEIRVGMEDDFAVPVQPVPEPEEQSFSSTKEAWWAGYRAGKGLPADMPRQEAVRADANAVTLVKPVPGPVAELNLASWRGEHITDRASFESKGNKATYKRWTQSSKWRGLAEKPSKRGVK